MKRIFVVIEERSNGVEVVHAAFDSKTEAQQYIQDEKTDVDSLSDADSILSIESIPFFPRAPKRGVEELKDVYLERE